MSSENIYRHFSVTEYCLIFLCFSFCLSGALLLPVNQCPDEAGRILLSDWICRTGRLPTGLEKETVIPGWGFSYALRPYLSSILGAAFKSFVVLFTDSPRALLAASRMCSVLAITGTCIFCLLLSRLLFVRRSSAVLFASLVCFLPQVIFLGMYQNNDSLSLLSVTMMLYFMIDGRNRKWSITSCSGLAIAISIGLLSYYSIYGWIVMCVVFCIVSVLLDDGIADKEAFILKRVVLISLLCILLAGWFFIRNYLVHDGDVFGLSSELRSREYFRSFGGVVFDYVSLRDNGLGVVDFFQFRNYEWIRVTVCSFVGVFGYLNLFLPENQYRCYFSVLAFGVLLALIVFICQKKNRKIGLFVLTLVLSVGITIALHAFQSYIRDYQPQGRYIISAALLMAYVIVYGVDRINFSKWQALAKSNILHPTVVLTLIWLSLFVWAFFGTMVKMIP